MRKSIKTVVHPFGHGGVSSRLQGIIRPNLSWVDPAVSISFRRLEEGR